MISRLETFAAFFSHFALLFPFSHYSIRRSPFLQKKIHLFIKINITSRVHDTIIPELGSGLTHPYKTGM